MSISAITQAPVPPAGTCGCGVGDIQGPRNSSTLSTPANTAVSAASPANNAFDGLVREITNTICSFIKQALQSVFNRLNSALQGVQGQQNVAGTTANQNILPARTGVAPQTSQSADSPQNQNLSGLLRDIFSFGQDLGSALREVPPILSSLGSGLGATVSSVASGILGLFSGSSTRN